MKNEFQETMFLDSNFRVNEKDFNYRFVSRKFYLSKELGIFDNLCRSVEITVETRVIKMPAEESWQEFAF